jgi:hypothetical protein
MIAAIHAGQQIHPRREEDDQPQGLSESPKAMLAKARGGEITITK